MICSPSNGGCDELTRRLKHSRNTDRSSALYAIHHGQAGSSSSLSGVRIVRVGRSEGIHSDCDDVGFESMVKIKMDELMCKRQADRSSSWMQHYNELVMAERTLKMKIHALKSSSAAAAPKNAVSFSQIFD